jgi:hypothetical protein
VRRRKSGRDDADGSPKISIDVIAGSSALEAPQSHGIYRATKKFRFSMMASDRGGWKEPCPLTRIVLCERRMNEVSGSGPKAPVFPPAAIVVALSDSCSLHYEPQRRPGRSLVVDLPGCAAGRLRLGFFCRCVFEMKCALLYWRTAASSVRIVDETAKTHSVSDRPGNLLAAKRPVFPTTAVWMGIPRFRSLRHL